MIDLWTDIRFTAAHRFSERLGHNPHPGTPTPSHPTTPAPRAPPSASCTATCNATGQPAGSVPLDWNDGGLPIGAHFVAPFGDEATLFRLATQLEQARPWADRRPPVSATAVSA